jgi:hypothetical protein
MARKFAGILETLLILSLVLCGSAWGQQPGTQQPMLLTYSGVPWGSCQAYQIATNTSTGAYYICNISGAGASGNGVWQQLVGLQFVVVAPSGTCTNGANPQVVIGTGVLYTCQGGTWGAVGVSSFPVTSAVAVNSGGSITVNTGGSIGVAGGGTINATQLGGQSAPASAVVGINDTQTLSNKSIAGSEINSGTVPSAQIPAINLAASGNGGVTGVLPGANMAATNLAASGNGGVTGVLPVANEGSGTPASGKYVDGGTGAWTALPGGSYNGSSPNGTYNVTSDQTISSGSLTLIPGLTWTMPASAATVSSFSCHLIYYQVSGTQTDAFGIQDVTVAPSNIMAKAQVDISASTFTAGNLPALTTTTATNIVSFTPSAATTIWNADIDGTVEQPSNASSSVVQIMALTGNVSNGLVIKRGSYCRVF